MQWQLAWRVEDAGIENKRNEMSRERICLMQAIVAAIGCRAFLSMLLDWGRCEGVLNMLELGRIVKYGDA